MLSIRINLHFFYASSLVCGERLNRSCFLHTNSVTKTAAGASFCNGHMLWGCGGGQPCKCIRFINRTHTRE